MHWVGNGLPELSAVGTILFSSAPDATLGDWSRSEPGMAVLGVALVGVSLGLVWYRATANRDRNAETDEQGPEPVSEASGGDHHSGEAVPTGRDRPESGNSPHSGDTSGDGAVGSRTDDITDRTANAGSGANTADRASVDGSGADTAVPTGERAPTNGVDPESGAGIGRTEERFESEMGEAMLAPPDSDEVRVLELLDANGGRLKQAHIVEETDWSKSKVSTLLSEMDEADTVTKLRLGRENLICLDGEEPELALSPSEKDREST
jgi:hypothetical protein